MDRFLYGRFLILTRHLKPELKRLKVKLAPLGSVDIVADSPCTGGVWYSEAEVTGHEGLMGQADVFPALTAWSRAFYHLSRTLRDEDFVWFIEEGVAGSPECWEALVRLTADSGADLAAWEVGPRETWMAEKVSIWHAGVHDNPLGQRLTALMISKGLADSAVPMSLLAGHPNVQFNYFRSGLGRCGVEMH